MELRITRIDPTLPMPEYQTPGSVAFDVYARESVTIAPKTIALIPTNLIVCVPEGYVLLLASRSSTPKKSGLLPPHGIGVLDQDYCGPKDEMLVQVWNFTDAPSVVERGQRIAQALIMPIERCTLVEAPVTTEKSRGGVGSTG